ncbi:MAG: hypothetical protein ABJJ44_06070 [Paraglaciecola sp.]|uniref:hypothetical protein n=1 Tax=Paraglaciecola sp. TaxID=1920173 RepID=UPI003297BB0F
MNSKVANFKNMQRELQEALSIIEARSPMIALPTIERNDEDNIHIDETDSLLNRCKQVVDQNHKPTLRIVHHFACSGGSLISKCIAAMPNTYLLSEVHPHSQLHLLNANKARYLPSDYTTLSRHANVPKIDQLSEELFVSSVDVIHKHVNNFGGFLILRDHSHVDFCTDNTFPKISTINNLLHTKFNLINLVTIRNPVDSYLSLVESGWIHFSPGNFDNYCKRLLMFLNQFKNKQIIKYESFVRSPDRTLKKICKNLDIPYLKEYKDIFNSIKVTGDSGRRSGDIKSRERRGMDTDFASEVLSSKRFKEINKKYGYTL